MNNSETLKDHFCDHTFVEIGQPQPEYGTIQLNVRFKDQMISLDVNLADLQAAITAVTS